MCVPTVILCKYRIAHVLGIPEKLLKSSMESECSILGYNDEMLEGVVPYIVR